MAVEGHFDPSSNGNLLNCFDNIYSPAEEWTVGNVAD